MASRKIKVKPGKTISAIGIVVAIIFVIIGCAEVIPEVGAFGMLWTGLAVIILVIHLKNTFSDEGIATHEIIMEDTSDDKRNIDDEDIETKLLKLNSLYEQGLLTKEEYSEKRKELLDKF